MVAIPQGLTLRCFCALIVVLIVACGCQRDGGTATQTQRSIGDARMQDDLYVSLTYGTVRGFSPDQIVMRSASPLVAVTVESGSTAVGPIDVELRNQHLAAELRVAAVTYLDSEDVDGCPVVTGFEVDCLAAMALIGTACETSGQCAEGLRCAASTCEPSDAFEPCVTPETRRLQGQENSLQFDLELLTCTRLRLETFLEPGDEPLRFGVLGPTANADMIAALADTFREADLDFLVLLGDNVSTNDDAGLAELERVLTLLGTPTVVVAGPRETAFQGGEGFLRRFGPHDHVWEIKGAKFFAFFSAHGTLGKRGLSRLDGFLSLLGTDENAPLIGVTHVPPFDPNELRDNSFRNDIEAAQVMSLLEQSGVHQLYAGGLGTGYEQIVGVETFVTTGSGTFAQPTQEWLLVEVDADGEGRVVGERVVSTDRIAL